jgi:DNA-binding winged helix-turn-helix (wHTH) protein
MLLVIVSSSNSQSLSGNNSRSHPGCAEAILGLKSKPGSQAATKDGAMIEPVTETRDAISLSFFSLDASPRLLVEDGIGLGARTLDTLMELVSRPCDVASKNDRPTRVCPDVIVEEGSLRFHIVDLRKAFGYAKDDARDTATLRARGYCLVAGDRVEELPLRFAFRTPIFRVLTGMFGRENADDAYE